MSNLSTLPKGDSAWLLRKAIERIIQQVSVLETNIGSSTTGNSANTQVIFNDAGTLRGDAGLTYNAASDILSFGAGICYGDLTVDTSTLKVDSANNRVGIGTASPTVALDVVGASAISGTVSVGTTTPLATGSGRGNVTVNGSTDAILAFGIAGVNSGFVLQDSAGMTLLSSGATYLRCYTNGSERYKIDSTGVATWSNVGGVAGTAMTLNSTGLGLSGSPSYKFTVTGSASGFTGSPSIALYDVTVGSPAGSRNWLIGNVAAGNYGELNFCVSAAAGGAPTNVKMTLDSSGNVGVGVTPSTSRFLVKGDGTNIPVKIIGTTGDTTIPHLVIDKKDNNTTTSQLFIQFVVADNGAGSGQINANGVNQAAFGTYSDSRLKKNIVNLPSQLANILSLRPVEFDYKDGNGHQIGFIAQEMQEVYADAVGEQEGFLTVSGWNKTEARLVSAIKELAAKVQALESKLA